MEIFVLAIVILIISFIWAYLSLKRELKKQSYHKESSKEEIILFKKKSKRK